MIFLIDRKDLDDQTVDEYNSFEKDYVDQSDSTSVLIQHMKDPQRKLILFHGDRGECHFVGTLEVMLLNHQLEIIGHSHPGEEDPEPSPADRAVLRKINQKKSIVI